MLELINTIILACTVHAVSEGFEDIRTIQKKKCIKELLLCVENSKNTELNSAGKLQKCLTR